MVVSLGGSSLLVVLHDLAVGCLVLQDFDPVQEVIFKKGQVSTDSRDLKGILLVYRWPSSRYLAKHVLLPLLILSRIS